MAFEELSVGVAKDLASAGVGVFGTSDPTARTIFIGEMPTDVEEGLVIIDAAGSPPHSYIDTEYAVIDFWARSPHTDRAKALLRTVNERLYRRYDWTTASWYIYFCRVLGPIQDIDRDNEGGKMFRLSVQFICRNLSHVS